MEFYNKVGFEVHVDELQYDLGFTGYAIVYRQIGSMIKVKQLYFSDDHIYLTRLEAETILRSISIQYIEVESSDP
jgi:hypothetical protein